MSRYYFFSDAHLGAPHCENEEKRQQLIITFLDHVKKDGKGLYIVGDLFDFWFEYRYAIPKQYFGLLAKLYELTESGFEINYVAGNHDMWLGDFLQESVGIRVFHQGVARNLFGYNCFIFHGDGAAKSDRGYRLLKRILKHPINIWLYRLLSPDIGFPLALQVSRTSRNHKESDSRWDQEYLDYARGKFAEGFDVVMMGHTHKPNVIFEGQKMFINLGDWLKHFTYCIIDESGPRMETWTGDHSQERSGSHEEKISYHRSDRQD